MRNLSNKLDVVDNVVDNVVDKKSKKEIKILTLISKNPKISAEEIAEQISISSRTVQRYLKILQEKKLIKHIGPAKGGFWQTANKNMISSFEVKNEK